MKFAKLGMLVLVFGYGTAHAAGNDGGLWLDGLAGKQSVNSLKPTSYGLSFGLKGKSAGFEGLFFTGSKSSGGVDESITQLLGRIDLFAGGKLFYLGPEAGSATVKASATAGGVTASASVSGFVYGGGAGFNLPLGTGLSLGGDVSYVTGSFQGTRGNLLTYLGSVKLWF